MSLSRLTRTLLAALTFAGVLLPLGCTGGLDDSIEELYPPALLTVDPVLTCPAAGTATTLEFSTTETRVVTGNPSYTPIDRIDVVGTVSGLPAGESVLVATIPDETTCPVSRVVVATVTAGRFTAQLDTLDVDRFRVVAFATAAPTSALACPSESDCIEVAGGSVSGVAPSLLIRLR